MPVRAPHRALMLAGWAVLVAAPVVGWLTVPAVDSAALAYDSAPPSRALGALRVAVPGALVAMALLLAGAGRAEREARAAGVWIRGRDGLLVGASRLAGLVLAAVGGVLVVAAMIFGGPVGIISAFAVGIVVFSFLGRGRRGG